MPFSAYENLLLKIAFQVNFNISIVFHLIGIAWSFICSWFGGFFFIRIFGFNMFFCAFLLSCHCRFHSQRPIENRYKMRPLSNLIYNIGWKWIARVVLTRKKPISLLQTILLLMKFTAQEKRTIVTTHKHTNCKIAHSLCQLFFYFCC